MTTNQEKYYGTAEQLAEELMDASQGGECPMAKYDYRSCADCPADRDDSCYSEIVKWLQEHCYEDNHRTR